MSLSGDQRSRFEAFTPYRATQWVTVGADRDEAKEGAGYRRGERAHAPSVCATADLTLRSELHCLASRERPPTGWKSFCEMVSKRFG